jgi:ABC-type transport system involved in multi-copper enzyme maturation permease subunit
MNTVFALSGVVIKELYRRKDFYVLLVLTIILTLLMGSLNFFNDDRIVLYLKDVALVLIWLSGLVIAVGTAARQIPAEREQRTIFPLLAKPVTRAHLVAGKFLGCWLACGIALVVFYMFFGFVSLSREHTLNLGIYLQVAWMQWMMLAIVVSLVLLGSVLFSAPSANATICFAVILGILLLGRHLGGLAIQQPEPVRSILYALYFILPHLEWYHLRDFVLYGFSVPLRDVVLATLYALVYSGMLLTATWLVFRKQRLNT